jgi:nucleoside-diphosphate-sugar epimerase
VGNPYGYLKRVEEEMLEQACREIEANLSIGRLWGASGLFMPINRAYALSDFIMQAIETALIEIRATRFVYRRYSRADEFLRVLEATAVQNPRTLFNSGGPKLELLELAELVSQIIPSKVKERLVVEGNAPDLYFPNSNEFEKLAGQFAVPISNSTQLVEAAVTSHLR